MTPPASAAKIIMNLFALITLLLSVALALATSTTTASHDTTTLVNSHGVRQQATNGIISTVAGTKDEAGFSGDGGLATAAKLSGPTPLAVDSTGSYFIGSTSNVVRKVTASTGIISTVAGVNGKSGFGGDGGPATSASFDSIKGVAVDANGNLYIADSNNHRIRKVILSNGIVSTVAGTGVSSSTGDDGAATAATLSNPTDVAVDVPGNVYIADSSNGKIRKITISTGIITTVAGGGQQSGGLVDNILATNAYFSSTTGIAFDTTGNMYILVASANLASIKKVTLSTGIITTVAGGEDETVSGIAATKALLSSPTKIAVDKEGNIFVSESKRIRQITATTGIISVEAGSGSTGDKNYGDGSPAIQATLTTPGGIVFDPAGNVIFCDPSQNTVRKITFSGSAPSPSVTPAPAMTPNSSPSASIPAAPATTPGGSVSSSPAKTPSSSGSTSPTAAGSPAAQKSASTHSANTVPSLILVLISLPMALLW